MMEFLGELFEDIFDRDKKRGRRDHDEYGDRGHHSRDDHHGRDRHFGGDRNEYERKRPDNIFPQNRDSGSQSMCCQQCGKIENYGNQFCGNCGASLGAARRCQYCQSKLKAHDKFCTSCGAQG